MDCFIPRTKVKKSTRTNLERVSQISLKNFIENLQESYQSKEYAHSLVLAAKEGKMDIVKFIVENWCDYYSYATLITQYPVDLNVTIKRAFEEATLLNKVSVSCYLAKQLNREVILGAKACIKYGYFVLYKLLVEELISKDLMDNSYQELMVYAAIHGRLNVIKYLIANRAADQTSYLCKKDMVVLKKFRGDALVASCEYGQRNVVKFLLDNGVAVDYNDNKSLTVSIQKGQLDCFQLLIDYGLDVNASNNYALRMSVDNGWIEMVQQLLALGAYVNVDNDYCLKSALRQNFEEMIELLIKYGANIRVVEGLIEPEYYDQLEGIEVRRLFENTDSDIDYFLQIIQNKNEEIERLKEIIRSQNRV